MASTALLASKVVILEEEPNIPAITALPSAVLQILGITERGPIADRTLVTSFDEYKRSYGGFTLNSDVAIAAYGFFSQGGSFAWISRTVHFTDASDPVTQTATKGDVMLKNSGSAASPAIVGPGSETAPFAMDPGAHLDLDIGGGTVAATFSAALAQIASVAVGGWPLGTPTVGTETIGITVDRSNGGREQVFQVSTGLSTIQDVIEELNAGLSGVKAVNVAGEIVLQTDIEGLDAGVQVTDEGTLNAVLAFPTTKAVGTGNVADINAVTALEAEAVIEAAHAAAVDVVVSGTQAISVQTIATGATAEIQVIGTSTVDFGLDGNAHVGSDTTPEDTLYIEGKTNGSYTDNIKIAIEAATSGEAARFNLKVVVDGIVRETFPNVNMDDSSLDYVETRINDVNYGSTLVVVADQSLPYAPSVNRPVNGLSAAMVGGGDGLAGIADIDYIGNSAGPTGLFCFDRVASGRILIVPGVYTPGIHKGMLDYAEVWRNGSMFCVLDCPPQQTAQQVIEYVENTATLLEYSEFGAIYWPWLKIVNPQQSVFGTGENITVPPSGFVAGKYAANDQKIGGVYESPAGIGGGFGVLRGVVGVEDDPTGSSIHEVEDERKRDLVYPKRINPITRLPGTPWHIDGGRTLKSTGNFPNVGERRGVIFIEQTIKVGVVIFKHRFNNKTTRRQAKRVVTVFLTQEMNKGAFRSTNTAKAFFVDVSDQLNPVANEFAGIMTMRIGLATNKPAEYIVVLVTQDTRALEESLAA